MSKETQRLLEEFSQFEKGNFWKQFYGRVEKKRQTLSRKLETDPIDKIPGLQGQITAIRWVLGLPQDILGLPRETTEAE